MSTYYVPAKPFAFDRLKHLKPKRHAVFEEGTSDTTPDSLCLTDGTSYLWAHRTERGYATFTRYGLNEVEGIIAFLERRFRTKLVSEHEDEFETLVGEHYAGSFVSISFGGGEECRTIREWATKELINELLDSEPRLTMKQRMLVRELERRYDAGAGVSQ